MTDDTGAPDEDDRSLKPAREDLNRLLIEQFYRDSVAQYGPESDQVCALSRLLSPVNVAKKSN